MKVAFVQWAGSELHSHHQLFCTDPSHRAAYYGIPHESLRSSLMATGVSLMPHEGFSNARRADALVSVDLPSRKRDLTNLIKNKIVGNAPLVLIAMESVHSRPELLFAKELATWHHVFHYSSLLPIGARLTRYYLPSNLPFLAATGPDFIHDRKRLVGMMGTNKSSRISNVKAWPLAKLLNGYQFSIADLKLLLSMRDGLRLRRQFASHLARLIPGEFQVFGGQWNGKPYSFHHRIIKPKGNPCAMGHSFCNPISIIKGFYFFFATENIIGDCGYLTEKLFNVIRAESVPIYQPSGNSCELTQAINDVGRFFVDLSRFPCPTSLVNYLFSMDAGEYQEYIQAGRRFLDSRYAKMHLCDSYAADMSDHLTHFLMRY